ncbi:MAG: restriction endonuclease subunit S [Mariniphaga sp.]
MSKYQTYKPSSIEWIGDVPENWSIKKIKNISQIVSGSTPSSSIEKYWNGDVVWVTPGDYSNHIKTISSSENCITEEGYKSCGTTLVPKGSIVLTTRAPIGNVLIADTELCTNQGCKSIIPTKAVSSFLYHVFSISQIELNNLGQGTTFLELSRQNLSTFKIPFPEKEEQVAIANYLDTETQKIDRLIANKKAQAEKLKELRQIEINNAVTKGLNLNVELKDSGIDWLGKIPKHWEVKRLKNVSNFIQTGITPPSEKSEYYEGDIPWYGPGGFNGDTVLSNPAKYITQQAIDDNEAKLFPIDSIFMIGIGATIGKVGIIKEPSSCNQQLNIINFKSNVSPDFGVYLLKTYESIIIKIANFSTLPIYNQVQTGNLKFLLPPKEEQNQITKYIQERTVAIDKLIKNIESQIEKLQELRKIKIYEAVTGKIKVNAYAEKTA